MTRPKPDSDITRIHLTDRERAVLTLRANGKEVQDVAKELGISLSSVTGACTRSFRVLGASNTVQAVAIAIALGDIGLHEIHIPARQRKAA